MALYAKNFPDILRKTLEEHKAGDSFLELVQAVKESDMIANGITIVSALFNNSEHSIEDNARV